MPERHLLLPQLISEWAGRAPERVLLQHVDGTTRTYGQLHRASLMWAGALRRLGVGTGDTVATLLPASFDAYAAWLGCSWLNAIEVPINTMYRGWMLRYVLTNSQATVLVAGSDFLDRLAKADGALDAVRVVVVPDADTAEAHLHAEIVTRDRFFSGAEPDADFEGPAPHDISCMIYTSGTTGPSKGVLVPWAEAYYFSLGPTVDALDEDGANYSFWPPYHISGKAALYQPVLKGARLVMRETFSASEFWNDVRRLGCTTGILVGPLARLLFLQPPSPGDTDNPLVGVAVVPLFPEIEEFKVRFGVEVCTGYGLTEVGGPLRSDGWHTPPWRSCGQPLRGPPGYEVKVVDEHDQPVGPGVVGELVVRADEPWAMCAGYFGMPEATAAAWRNGWFHTGDGFRYDDQGNFAFVDRIKDAIRRRGENISSFEVEAFVLEHPAVTECAAIGVPSEHGEEEVKVCVVVAPDHTLEPEDLIEFLAARMPRFMVPRFVEFVPGLPKTEATARVRKVELREQPLNESTWDREAAGIVLPR